MSDERAAAIEADLDAATGDPDATCRVVTEHAPYLLAENVRLRETIERVRDALATDDQAVLKVAAAQQILIDAAALSSSPNKEN